MSPINSRGAGDATRQRAGDVARVQSELDQAAEQRSERVYQRRVDEQAARLARLGIRAIPSTNTTTTTTAVQQMSGAPITTTSNNGGTVASYASAALLQRHSAPSSPVKPIGGSNGNGNVHHSLFTGANVPSMSHHLMAPSPYQPYQQAQQHQQLLSSYYQQPSSPSSHHSYPSSHPSMPTVGHHHYYTSLSSSASPPLAPTMAFMAPPQSSSTTHQAASASMHQYGIYSPQTATRSVAYGGVGYPTTGNNGSFPYPTYPSPPWTTPYTGHSNVTSGVPTAAYGQQHQQQSYYTNALSAPSGLHGYPLAPAHHTTTAAHW
jgi:hypothetical protein